MHKKIITFPGQGSQYIGMGKAIAEFSSAAREVFEEVDDALNQKLFALMTEGAEADLNLTENTQPALMAVSLATLRVLENESGQSITDLCDYVAGHSLGEYSAITAASVIDVATCAKLLRIRGQAMQNAVPVGAGAMAAILGLSMEQMRNLVQHNTDGMLAIANDNSDGQVVISGHKASVEAAAERAKEMGAKRAVMLPVSAPFHCPLMQPAAKRMAEALSEINFVAPVVPVITNVTVAPQDNPQVIKDGLVEQVTGSVRWRESVLWAAQNGVTQTVEIGAGKVLTGLNRRIDKNLTSLNIETPQDIENFLEQLNKAAA